jgi:protein-S-isoprenylcysteine O-methyltransferase Ste14
MKIMNSSNIPNSGDPKKAKYLSPWLAYPLALLVWWALPWAISLLTPHYGWVTRRPGLWNLLGLILVLFGTIGLLWGVAVHAAQSSKGIEWELDKSYLLRGGMYIFSRNPMYLFELMLLFGWVIFYGSVSLVIAFVIAYLLFNYYLILQEEHVLDAHFGEAYREYKKKVPRWFGKIRR